MDDMVEVEYHRFTLQVFDSPHTAAAIQPPGPQDWLVAGGPGGVLFHSAGNDHTAAVRLELWASPPVREPGEWEAVAEDDFTADFDRLLLASFTSAPGQHVLTLPAPGAHRVRAYVRGRTAIEAAGPVSFAEGIERWLVQIWPA
ncbi:hypothetical protein [Saccharothrix hoggarensis]